MENAVKLKCPDCGKEFDFVYRKEAELVRGSRDKEIKELYLDCPNADCGENNKYRVEIDHGK